MSIERLEYRVLGPVDLREPELKALATTLAALARRNGGLVKVIALREVWGGIVTSPALAGTVGPADFLVPAEHLGAGS